MASKDIAYNRAVRLFLGTMGVVLISACSPDNLGPDELEFANIRTGHIVPKSSPKALIAAFDSYCVSAPRARGAADRLLRSADYVPVRKYGRKGVRVYVVDDKRPAIARSSAMCIAQASSRTGQTYALQEYVLEKFPHAKPMDTASLPKDIEQAWMVSNPPAMVASQRRIEIGNYSSFGLIYFRPKTANLH